MSPVYWFILITTLYLSVPFVVNHLGKKGPLWKKYGLDLFITEIDYLFWLPITLGCLLLIAAGFTLLLGRDIAKRIWPKILSVS